MIKKLDELRSVGSIAHKCFGALLCDICHKPSNYLYEESPGGETSICSECFDEEYPDKNEKNINNKYNEKVRVQNCTQL